MSETALLLYVCLSVWLAAMHNPAEQPFSLSLSLLLCAVSAGIFHHLVPSVSSQQSGTNLPGSSQQRHLDTIPKPGVSFLASGSTQPSRTQTVLHTPSPPAHSLPPPPPLLNATSSSSSAPTQTSSPSLVAASASSRPFTVHYSPHLPPPQPPSSAGSVGAGALGAWRTLGMQASYTASQIPGNRPR